MYLTSSPAFAGLIPGADGVSQLYGQIFKQLGCAVFAPFALGQLLHLVFPRQSDWAMKKLYLNKVGSFCLLLVIWATFSGCFYYKALENISHQSVILVCFFNIGLYIFFTLFVFFIARPPYQPTNRLATKVVTRFSKLDTIAICFCAPAKSVSIGAPLIGVMWSEGFSNSVQSLVMVPIVLYQAEQILCGQIVVVILRWWARDEWMTKKVPGDEETVVEESGTETSEHTLQDEESLGRK